MIKKKQSFFKKYVIDNSIFLILISNTLFASFIMQENSRSIIVLTNYIVVVVLMLFCILNYKISFNKINILIILLLSYFMILLFFSSDQFISFNYYVKFVLGMAMFTLSYSAFKTKEDIMKLFHASIIILTFGVGFFIITNMLGYGDSMYPGQFIYKGQSHNLIWTMYSVATLVIFQMFFSNIRNIYKMYVMVLIALVIITLLLIFKRTPLIIIFVGIILYFGLYKYKYKVRFFIGLMIIFIIGISFYPIWFDSLKQNIYTRYDRLQGLKSFEREGRYLENIAVIQYVSKNPLYIIFGSGEPFNSRHRYDAYSLLLKYDRQIHNNYANLLWSGGVIGLTLYIIIFLLIIKKYLYFKKRSLKYSFEYLLALSGLVLSIIYLVTGFSGGLTLIVYQSYILTCIGAFLGYLSFQYYVKKSKNLKKVKLVLEPGEKR